MKVLYSYVYGFMKGMVINMVIFLTSSFVEYHKNKDYEFYRGVCFTNHTKEVLNDIEYSILLAVIDNIKIGYYDGGNYDKEEKIYSKD